MADVTVTKKNEVYLRVDASPSIVQEIADFFTFDAPNAKFHPLYRMKKWDGKVRLMSVLIREVYVGLLSHLEHFCKTNNYTIDYSQCNFNYDNVTPDTIRDFVNDLNVNLPGGDLVREYQHDAICRAIIDGRRLLLSPTGSGKSCILYSLIRWNEQFGRKQLILVPNTVLCEQIYSDFQSYSQSNGWKVSDNCSRIYSGYSKDNLLPVVISTWQSVYLLPKSFFSEYDCVYMDECHLGEAKSLTGIMNKLINAPYRVGTTGTLNGTKTNKIVLEGLFGPVYNVTTTRQLIDDNHLSDLKIYGIILQYPDDIKKSNNKLKYPDEMNFLCSYEARNKFIRNLAIKQKGNTLVLFQFIEKHGDILHNLISLKADEGRKVFYVHGGTDTEQREEIRKITETETDAIIVGSYGCMSTGVNIRNLHNIIFASPTKSRIRNLQSLGRGLRLADEKTKCKLYDIGDDISWKNKKNYTLLHMIERIKIYADEQFDYKILKVDL